MTDPRILLARYTKDVLVYDYNLIKIGRRNWKKDDNETNYIVIDEPTSTKISSNQSFDGVALEIKKTDTFKADFTLDFYGTDAFANSRKWTSLVNTQLASELQAANSLSIKQVQRILNIGALTGAKYSNRYQINITIWYNYEETVPTNSLLTAEFNLKVNNNEKIINKNIEV